MSQPNSNVPTRKWMVTQVTAIAALLVAYINADGWNRTLSIALIGLLSQAIIGYLVRNADVVASSPTEPASVPSPAP